MITIHSEPRSDDWEKLVDIDGVAVVFDRDVKEGDVYEAESCHVAGDISLSTIPVACATLVDSWVNPIDDSSSERPRERLSFDAADPTVDVPLSYSRPQFIFASARVTVSERRFGIRLKDCNRGGAIVARLTKDSPFLNSNIQPGDHVVAVNGILCSSVRASRVVKLIKSTTEGDTMSICVHNPSGDPHSVSNSVQKMDHSTKVGVALQVSRGAVRMSRVDKDGLFGNSLLMPHHRCVMINGVSCSHMNSKTAAELILSLEGRVTIVSRPEGSYALTIALCQKRKWWSRVAGRSGTAVCAVPACKVL